jgi:hypothetical protein
VDSGAPDATGLATVSAGDVPLGEWLRRTFVQPALDHLT